MRIAEHDVGWLLNLTLRFISCVPLMSLAQNTRASSQATIWKSGTVIHHLIVTKFCLHFLVKTKHINVY